MAKTPAKLRMGMVGGGIDAFIGAVHRTAALLDNEVELVAGALSSTPEKARLSGEKLRLDPDRVYTDYREMARLESIQPPETRLDFVSIVTPNYLHVPVASAFLEAGFHVVCDKPLAVSLAEAKKLRRLIQTSGKMLVLTHNYSGYPLVKEAREWVRKGKLGSILKVVVEYSQDWLLSPLETTGQKQADWRLDPKRAGISCCTGDIGTHAEHLARYITGLEIDSLAAELTSFVSGRTLDDDANIFIRYKGGAKGVLIASQVSAGEENNLCIRIYGTKGGLEWHQEDPNELIFKQPGKPREIWRRGQDYLSKSAREGTRLPPGHPEAFLEAFANVYGSAVQAIRADKRGKNLSQKTYPDVDDGVHGMAFIEAAVKSSRANTKWVSFPSSD